MVFNLFATEAKMSGRVSRVLINGNPGSFLDIEEGDFVREGNPEFRDGKYIGRPFIVTKLTSTERDTYNLRAAQNKLSSLKRFTSRIFG